MSEVSYIRLVEKQKQAIVKLEEIIDFLSDEYEKQKVKIAELEHAQNLALKNRFSRDELIIELTRRVEKLERIRMLLSTKYEESKFKIEELEIERRELLLQLMQKKNPEKKEEMKTGISE